MGAGQLARGPCPSPPIPHPWAVDSRRGICSVLSHCRLHAPAPLSPSTPAVSGFMVNGVYSVAQPS